MWEACPLPTFPPRWMALPAELSLSAFAVALLGGAASFISPCVLPLLPAYLSFVSGQSLEELQSGRRRIILNTATFVLGFALVFTLLGAILASAGVFVGDQRTLQIVAGAVLIVLGALLASAAYPGFMVRERRPLLEKVPRGPAGAFALGVAIALGWTPCVGPILASILTLAVSGSNPAGGALLLFVYSLGLGIPFLISGLFVGWALRTFSRVKRRIRLVQIVCGVILVVYGALLVSGRFGLLSSGLSALHVPSF